MRLTRVVGAVLTAVVVGQLVCTAAPAATSVSGRGTGIATVFIGVGPGAPAGADDHAVDDGRYLISGVLGNGTLHDATFIYIHTSTVSWTGTSKFVRSDGATLAGTVSGAGPIDGSSATGTLDLVTGTGGLAGAAAHLTFSVKNTNWHLSTHGNTADELFTFSGTVTGGTAAAPPSFPIQFGGIRYDPPGPDTGTNTSLNAEYATVRNYGTTAKDLTGFTLRDAQNHIYSFPPSFMLAPGHSVRIHTGMGADNATDLFWGRTAYVWDNGGDVATSKNGSTTTDTCAWTTPAAGYRICLT